MSRALVEEFYDAYGRRDLGRIDQLLADDVRWTINGPVELLQFCGARRGKRAVLDMIQDLADNYGPTSLVPDTILVDGDRAAGLARLAARRSDDGRIISFRLAQFLQFKDGKVVDYCSVIDSFDAAEQVLGRRFEVPRQHRAADSDLIRI